MDNQVLDHKCYGPTIGIRFIMPCGLKPYMSSGMAFASSSIWEIASLHTLEWPSAIEEVCSSADSVLSAVVEVHWVINSADTTINDSPNNLFINNNFSLIISSAKLLKFTQSYFDVQDLIVVPKRMRNADK